MAFGLTYDKVKEAIEEAVRREPAQRKAIKERQLAD